VPAPDIRSPEALALPSDFFNLFMPIVLGLLALTLLGIGLRGLLTRRPFVFAARWLFAFMLLSFLPNAIMPLTFERDFRDASDVFLTLAGPAMFLVLAVFFWIVMRGHMAFGVTEESLRSGLTAALRELELPYEESLGAIRLPSVPAEIQVAVQGWVGTGQIKSRQRAGSPLVADVARRMNAYFRTTKVSTNLTCCVMYIVMGTLTGAMDIVLFCMR
jgi:hypothetical protein